MRNPIFGKTAWAKSWLLIDVDGSGFCEIERHDALMLVEDDDHAVRRARREARRGRRFAMYAVAMHQHDKRALRARKRERDRAERDTLPASLPPAQPGSVWALASERA